MSDKSVLLFAAKVIFLFFTFLLILYWIIPIYSFILSLLVEPVMTTIYPRFIHSISAKNGMLETVTNFAVMGQAQTRLAFDMNPLKYSYGLPLFLALLLASKGPWRDKVWYLMIAFFVLLLSQTWSISFDITRNLLFEFQGAYAAHFDYGPLAKGLVSLGSQLGFLLFPALVPVILWVIFMPKYFQELTVGSSNNTKL